jgi:t-SNARE complex subunit (syntaxin)
MFSLVTQQDPNIDYIVEKTISAPHQKEPPPFDRVRTVKGHLGASLAMVAGYAIAFVILALVVLFLLFLIFVG